MLDYYSTHQHTKGRKLGYVSIILKTMGTWIIITQHLIEPKSLEFPWRNFAPEQLYKTNTRAKFSRNLPSTGHTDFVDNTLNMDAVWRKGVLFQRVFQKRFEIRQKASAKHSYESVTLFQNLQSKFTCHASWWRFHFYINSGQQGCLIYLKRCTIDTYFLIHNLVVGITCSGPWWIFCFDVICGYKKISHSIRNCAR